MNPRPEARNAAASAEPHAAPEGPPLTRRELREREKHRDAESVAVPPRAGRDLRAAIPVGLVIGAAFVASLVFNPVYFVFIAGIAAGAALWEFGTALHRTGVAVPRLPLVVGGALIVIATYFGGQEAQWLTFALAAGAVLLWCVLDRSPGPIVQAGLGVFALGYIGLLASFATLMVAHFDGSRQVIVFLAMVVANDVGGYVLGVLIGKHPIAPSVSPKKSWEGFLGSAVLAVAVGIWLIVWLLDGPVWTGVVFGIVIAIIATLGDFSESMIKRDLDLKDMGTLLPGHGGVMDRLDSILPVAPIAYLLFLILPGLS
ncbi:phosphatidate cytidylyltransferase [Spelaeicoccus albus]|uniref:Phosphatidate cytidylyltransferase n=1 Tax=Spelaeicoccus albus TaxID=1280376 RepID=A0A7Z0IHH5_9MICO|nr:phosphatidate cytidylyltransferase [Spelaeicoccus albus]NYI67758.1 phosphatidate cytidylyltransferase [Spelaeicoccus albus]